MDIKDTISGFKGVLEGKYDDLPEVRRLLFSACARMLAGRLPR